MQLIITDPWLTRRGTAYLSGAQVIQLMMALMAFLVVVSFALYQFLFMYGASRGWPIVTPMVQWMSQGERDNQERYMKENLDALARKVGEMQARMVLVDSLGERVASLAGVPAPELKRKPAAGGALVMPEHMSVQTLGQALDALDQTSESHVDWFTVMESHLFDEKMRKYMLPTSQPVPNVELGSGFGWRIDPLTGLRAMHTGLDFSSDVGTPIFSAASGVVVNVENHPAYGTMVEVDHGNQLMTRYAHCSRVYVKKGDLVKRGQRLADVGITGRTTGAHLHFEVWLAGVAQDPQKFLKAGEGGAISVQALSGSKGRRLQN
jgi:murein DD-endopeptidase MepM/ murein hydrolase activator NlpD